MPVRVTPTAITGMGLVTAAGAALPETLASLGAPADIPEPVPPPFATEFPSPVFRCPLEMPELTKVSSSRTVALALRAAREALSSAGLEEGEFGGLRTGVIVGTSVGASLDFWDFYRDTAKGHAPPLSAIEQYLASNPAQALARLLGCRGPAHTVVNACSSGADAIGMAAAWVRSGLCDIVLAGGADALSPVTYAGFCSLRLPSPTVCRPFDANRDGLTLGEGAGFMILESEASRKQRGAPAQSFLAGYGTATDAYHLTAPHPEGKGLLAAVNQAFAQAGLSWTDMAFINAHGTATPANDAAEGLFFRTHCPGLPFIATKGATGHTLGAAGAVEAVLTAAHLNEGRLPASPRFSSPDSGMAVAPVSAPCAVHGHFALSQSLAFGGNNSVLVLAKGEA